MGSAVCCVPTPWVLLFAACLHLMTLLSAVCLHCVILLFVASTLHVPSVCWITTRYLPAVFYVPKLFVPSVCSVNAVVPTYIQYIPAVTLVCNFKLPDLTQKGSSGGSLVAILDCNPTVPGPNLATSPAYSGLPVLRRVAFWCNFVVGCPLRGGIGVCKKKDCWFTKSN
jgi:hypothetical protein